MEKIEIKCLEVEQPIGTFYIGIIDSRDLFSISFAEIRRPDGRDIERHIGTQRDLSPGRVANIKQYVTNVDASFPTSVILAIDSKNIEFDEKNKILKVVKNEKVAKIIDGQHRIAGLEDYSGVKFEINVTIFVDMDIEDQAMVFATINISQTKVTKSLVYDLYEYTKSRSPQKTCHEIVKLVHSKENSPFYKRIKILGKATGVGSELITQSTFVDRLLRLISNDPMGDRDKIKRNKKLVKELGGYRAKVRVLRNLFVDEKDAKIAKIIWNYYKAVGDRWPTAWNDFDRGKILARSTGFAGLMRVLPKILNNFQEGSIPKENEFLELLNKSKLKDKDFTSDNYKPGSSGEGMLVKDLQDDLFGR